MEIWESIASEMMETKNIIFASQFEANVAVMLNIMNIDFSYKTLKFYFDHDGNTITYTPDFVLSYKHENRQVLLEPHGKRFVDKRFIENMHRFKESDASKDYCLVLLIDKMPKRPDKLKIELKKYGYKESDICDMLWRVPYNQKLGIQLNLKNENGSVLSKLNRLKDENEKASIKNLLRSESKDKYARYAANAHSKALY